jgi:hypothetical protein
MLLLSSNPAMRQVVLGRGLRILLGVLGAAALVAGFGASVVQMRSAAHASAPWAVVVLAVACLAIGCTGILLLRGAWRGTIAVRDPAGRAPRRQR